MFIYAPVLGLFFAQLSAGLGQLALRLIQLPTQLGHMTLEPIDRRLVGSVSIKGLIQLLPYSLCDKERYA